MTGACAAAGISDADRRFMRRFECCKLAESEWTHEAHVRIAWIAFSSDEPGSAERRLREGIRRFNARVLGRPGQYHDTVTVAFARIIASRLRAGETFAGFIERNADILSADKPLLLGYYSDDRLFSAKARREFVAPDKAALPRVVSGRPIHGRTEDAAND